MDIVQHIVYVSNKETSNRCIAGPCTGNPPSFQVPVSSCYYRIYSFDFSMNKHFKYADVVRDDEQLGS